MVIQLQWPALLHAFDRGREWNQGCVRSRCGPVSYPAIHGSERAGRGDLTVPKQGDGPHIGCAGHVRNVADHEGDIDGLEELQSVIQVGKPGVNIVRCEWVALPICTAVGKPEEKVEGDDMTRAFRLGGFNHGGADAVWLGEEPDVCVPADFAPLAAENSGQNIGQIDVPMVDRSPVVGRLCWYDNAPAGRGAGAHDGDVLGWIWSGCGDGQRDGVQ